MAPQTKARSSSSASAPGRRRRLPTLSWRRRRGSPRCWGVAMAHGQRCPAEELLPGIRRSCHSQAALRVVYEEVCQRQELARRVAHGTVAALSAVARSAHLCCSIASGSWGWCGGRRVFRWWARRWANSAFSRKWAAAGGRVYLAEQAFLAVRLMILKFIPLGDQEHLKLARVQHTHVVPLYSARDYPTGNLRKLVMPCLGGTALGQLLHQLRAIPPEKRTGRDLLEAMRAGVAEPAPCTGRHRDRTGASSNGPPMCKRCVGWRVPGGPRCISRTNRASSISM